MSIHFSIELPVKNPGFPDSDAIKLRKLFAELKVTANGQISSGFIIMDTDDVSGTPIIVKPTHVKRREDLDGVDAANVHEVVRGIIGRMRECLPNREIIDHRPVHIY